MLRKKYRVQGRFFFKGARPFHTPLFSVRIVENNLPYSRIGFIVSKKVDKRATVRNRTRRVLSSYIEEKYDKIRGGYDMLFFAKKELVNKERDIIYKTLENILKEKNLLS